MPPYTSANVTGVWEEPLDWVPTAPPGGPTSGDWVTINGGHTMTINSDVSIGEVGDDGTGEYAITFNSGSTLELAAGNSLRYHGRVRMIATTTTATTFRAGAGTTITHDSSSAPSPTTTRYIWELGTGTLHLANLELNGTQANPISWNYETANGAINGAVRGNLSGMVRADWTNFDLYQPYFEFSSAPTASDAGITTIPSAAPNDTYYRNCTFTGLVFVWHRSSGDNNVTYFENCNFPGPGINYTMLWINGGVGGAAPTNYIRDCVFGARIWSTNNFVTANYLHERCVIDGIAGTNQDHDYVDCVFKVYGNAANVGTDVLSSCLFIHDTSQGNPSYIDIRYINSGIAGAICQSTTTDQEGDCLNVVVPGLGSKYCRKLIVLPNADGGQSGTACSTTNTSGTSIEYKNLTVCSTSPGTSGILVGETAGSFAGSIEGVKDSIFHNRGFSSGWKMRDVDPTPATDVANASDLDYNLGWNLGTGSNGYGYDGMVFSVGTPGVNDIQEDPNFVDDTRDFPTFAIDGFGQAAGPAWTDQAGDYTAGTLVSSTDPTFFNTVINFRCINNHTPLDGDATNGRPGASLTPNWRTNWRLETWNIIENDTSQIPVMYAWIEAGFAPQNPSTSSAADPNGIGYMGAVPTIAIGTSTVTASNISGSDSESFSWTEV